MNSRYYNYGGFIETKVLEYDIDNNDLQILSYIAMIYASDKMEIIKYEDDYYVWLRAEKIVDDNPRLRIKKRALETRIADLVSKGLIKKVVKCDDKNVKKTYYRVTDKYREMLFTYENVNKTKQIDYEEEEDLPKQKKEKTTKGFEKPTLEEVREFCMERGNNINPEQFIAFYESNGWKVGKNPMKSWKSAIITWEGRNKGNQQQQRNQYYGNWDEYDIKD